MDLKHKIKRKKIKNKDGLTLEQQRNKVREAKYKDFVEKEGITGRLRCSNFFVRGIYFLYRDDKVVYVGQSKKSVMERITTHQIDKTKYFDSFHIEEYKDITDKALNMKEKKYIKKYKPEYNIVHNRNCFLKKVNFL